MSTEDVKKYFEAFGDVEVAWLNDSSCTVTLDSEEKARRAY